MRRLFPFVFAMAVTALCLALVTAYRSGLFARLAEVDWRERFAEQTEEVAEHSEEVADVAGEIKP